MQWRTAAGRRLAGYCAILFCCCLLHFLLPATAQKKTRYSTRIIAHTPVKSIRGLSVVTDSVLWASGTGGMVGRSTDGGIHWRWTQVPGCDSCDWRSLYAFDADKAFVLNAGAPAFIFFTGDGGHSWEQVFYDNRPGVFFDALQFFDEQSGIAVGDPLGDKFTVIHTHNGGRSWEADNEAALPAATAGEAIFAASGTSLVALPGKHIYFATGGTVARLFTGVTNWKAYTIPAVQGSGSTGIFSIAFLDVQRGVAVGGDYKQDTARNGNCLLTVNGGRSWYAPATPPGGYRSCVAYITPQLLIATGTSGTDISADGGKNWQPAGSGFNVAAKARKGNKVYLAGKDIAELIRR